MPEITYPLRIDADLWKKFKETFPRSKTPNKVITDTIKERVAEKEKD
ncbi:MAG: hypothetical protein MOIL_01390 [Candidatus Methanolliviera sp. GoM_oil]|nr:MAG: hypothetical protein MOIL_01390 [Candidatus Methanolliviera sp. GoM_oil]